MPGAGSCLDKNDHQLIRRHTRALERVGEELARLNNNLEEDDDGS